MMITRLKLCIGKPPTKWMINLAKVDSLSTYVGRFRTMQLWVYVIVEIKMMIKSSTEILNFTLSVRTLYAISRAVLMLFPSSEYLLLED